jgi:sugar phosphate isomerase/epimerase
MASLPIAAQLYTLRDIMPGDVEGTLRAVAGLGYRGVEFAGLHGLPASELRALLDELGLAVTSAHVALDLLERDFDGAIDTYRALGCPILVVPWLPEARRGDYAALGAALNRIGEGARAAGMRLAYHNHDFELRGQGGQSGLEILLETTDPALVGFELDCGWVAKTGGDPLALMRKLDGRLPLLHIKDVAANGDWSEVGQGVVDYRPIVAAAPGHGVEWLIVEQDTTRRPPLESLEMSLRWLREHATA